MTSFTTDTIGVRDYATTTAKDVKTTNVSDVHTPHHNIDQFSIALVADRVQGMVLLTNTTDTLALAAPTDSPDLSLRTYVDAVQVANAHATQDALVGIKDGTPASPDVAMAYVYVPAKSTVVVYYPIPLKTTVGNAVYVGSNATSTIYVSIQGHHAP